MKKITMLKKEDKKMEEVGIIGFWERSLDLKKSLRYTRLNKDRRESSADHSWSLSLMVSIITEYLRLDFDVGRVINIALIHDLPEAITGDIDAFDVASGKITKVEKQKLEQSAMAKMTCLLPFRSGGIILELWNEYEAGETPEAKFVKALDKLETTLQLVGVSECWDHPDFIATYPDKSVKNFPELLPLLREIKLKLKNEFTKLGLEWKEEFNYGLE